MPLLVRLLRLGQLVLVKRRQPSRSRHGAGLPPQSPADESSRYDRADETPRLRCRRLVRLERPVHQSDADFGEHVLLNPQ